jgi:acyl-CoA reductase-like NAD-dependent aldehyde dehydrogenase
MNSVTTLVAPSLAELHAVALKARAELDALQRERAALDEGMPTNPAERMLWYESKAELPILDAKLYRARARSEQADAALRRAREQHFAQVREDHAPERRALLRKMQTALDVAARVSADVQVLDEFVSLQCDGHGYSPAQAWAMHLTADGCTLERWERELRAEGWLP